MVLPPNIMAAVLAQPDDDAPRLVAADWLEEHGECDRAEFIRLGCLVRDRDALTTQRELEQSRRRISEICTKAWQQSYWLDWPKDRWEECHDRTPNLMWARGFIWQVYMGRECLLWLVKNPKNAESLVRVFDDHPVTNFSAGFHSGRATYSRATEKDRRQVWLAILPLMLPRMDNLICQVGSLAMSEATAREAVRLYGSLRGNCSIGVSGSAVRPAAAEILSETWPGRFLFKWEDEQPVARQYDLWKD